MSDSSLQFHFALARIATLQLLRSTGIDRAKPSVVDSLTDILVRYIALLGERSKEVAESAGRHACEMEDLRAALEQVGGLYTTHREEAREEEGVVKFITWCMSDSAGNMRRIAGEGKNEMGEDMTADWLTHLVQKQVKVSGEENLRESVLGTTSRLTVTNSAKKADVHLSNNKFRIDGPDVSLLEGPICEVMQDHMKFS